MTDRPPQKSGVQKKLSEGWNSAKHIAGKAGRTAAYGLATGLAHTLSPIAEIAQTSEDLGTVGALKAFADNPSWKLADDVKDGVSYVAGLPKSAYEHMTRESSPTEYIFANQISGGEVGGQADSGIAQESSSGKLERQNQVRLGPTPKSSGKKPSFKERDAPDDDIADMDEFMEQNKDKIDEQMRKSGPTMDMDL